MKVGIDRIEFSTPNRYLDLVDLAHARGADPNKYLIGIGQRKMAVPTLSQDIVAMGANAAEGMFGGLDDKEKASIGLLIVATESGVDQSKASALFVHDLLGLPSSMRAIEIKEACYGGTAGLQLAADFVRAHPGTKALVIAADIARYGLNAGGEVTQGAGAVAMLVAENPHILALEERSVVRSRSTDDFWRPNYSAEAFAKGKYSEQVYLEMFAEDWREAESLGLTQVSGLQALLFHIPFSKMGRKGLRTLESVIPVSDYERLTARFEKGIMYGQEVGNLYTASLYLSLISLLERDESLCAGDRIGLFSYGSGSVAELFFGILQTGYRDRLNRTGHEALLAARQRLSIDEYESIFSASLVTDGSQQDIEDGDPAALHALIRMEGHERFYR
ncbi:hydroxymethylglutaryl-CoA synthase [Bifidobacterium subtile]|jgi:hydroxymethylglutaryl-CoA synthase|uniref:Hydroxymethylglutaryl-CoA synthase n=1 Tax=Bifidobacterium subtile TaxID=77635 RepID=A0A087EAB8_9BIFI|nr:hydroxymethylglutaryl-CoA synthase [Bifidobacterium subtile]KFJ04719.1 hydroxymethylglutaryl-CoA synthase [Bifidobacterium subtile]MCI1222635.1 hydroxymethylglutaryl-CoA synthase [Bifidobacterium subtile]MCI1240778.1 hydroxymethylglutaryl-CoA synthase [Bifidobacterium subtile]MCI1257669.1 hydroxymethylglutaryl-CoA synthase [Bifidobacterium subtile]QOL35802.1 hydroxymethylglutaryl-CoA synthase [Bifidobacterium subtile]